MQNITFKKCVMVFLLIAALVWWFKPVSYGPAPDNQRPFLSKIAKLAKWVGWAMLFAEDPPAEDQPDAQTVQSLPQAPPVESERSYEKDREGKIVINHARGW